MLALNHNRADDHWVQPDISVIGANVRLQWTQCPFALDIRRPLLNRLPNGLTAKGLNGENDEMMTQRIRMMNTHTRKSRNRERKTYDTIKNGIK